MHRPSLCPLKSPEPALVRICIIGPARFPIIEPFAGGLEAHTHMLVTKLAQRGHEVTLFAAQGSDPSLNASFYDAAEFEPSTAARQDVGASPKMWIREHHAYLSLMIDLADSGASRFDVVLNVSIHHLPIAMSRLLSIPLVTTLHTPPLDWLESAMRVRGANTTFVTVSKHMQLAWADQVDSTVVLNGVDTDAWRFGPGGERAIWFGRIVPEKGVADAIRAAFEVGMSLDIAGPVHDKGYFEAEVEPWLGTQVRYLGHLDHSTLRDVVRHSKLAFVTPRWNEPYGLVAAEATSSGTPVAGFERGALPEVIGASSGRLVQAEQPHALAQAAAEAAALPRDEVREHAVAHCSLERMVTGYERVLDAAVSSGKRRTTAL